MNVFRKKSFQYGTAAVILVAVVLAFVVIVNILFSLFTAEFGWYADISSSRFFRFSEESLDLLDTVDRQNNKLTLYFLTDQNTLSATDYGKYILGLTTELENRYDFFTVKHFENIDKDFWDIAEVYGSKYDAEFEAYYNNKEFKPGTVILRNDTYETDENGNYIVGITGEKKKDYRVSTFTVNDMYAESASAFIGDLLLTGRILGITRNMPKVYFLSGHGNLSLKDDQDFGDAYYLHSLFLNAGYTPEKLDLSTKDFDAAYTDTAIAVIFAPRVDYTESEIKRLSDFVSKGGNLMVFSDGTYYALDKLNAFLASYGITVANAKIQSGADASLGNNGFMFVGNTAWDHAALKAVRDRDGKTVVKDCRLLHVDSTKGAEALITPPTSFGVIGSETALSGKEAVAALSEQKGRGSVFVSGASSLASSLVYAPAYQNRSLLLAVLESFGCDGLPLNVDVKTLASDGLDLTRGTATAVSVIVSLIPALTIAAVGAVICIRRKRS